MLRRALTTLALVTLAAAGSLVPTAASAADASDDLSLPRGVVFSSADLAAVPVLYTCTAAGGSGTEPLHVYVSQAGEATAEGDAQLTCDGTQHQTDARVDRTVGDFRNGTVSVVLYLGDGSPKQLDDVAATGVPEVGAPAQLEIHNGVVQFSSATEAEVGVSYTCGTPAAPFDDELHVAVWQPRASAYEARAESAPVPLVCDGRSRSTPQIGLTVEEGTFVNGYGDRNAEAWLGIGSEDAVTTEPVEIAGVPEVEVRADVTISIDATPEPATKGKKITVVGTILRNGKAYDKKDVTLEFRPDGGDYAPSKTVVASSKGKLSTTVTAARSGTFRWTSTGTDRTNPGASKGDHVEVQAAPKPKPKPKTYANCDALRKVYPHGVGKKGAKDKTSGTPVTTFTVDDATYAKNTKSDRDKDKIACEQA